VSTIAYVRLKVDLRLRQLDSKNRSYLVPEVDQAIREKYVARMASMPPSHVAEASAFTILAGTDTFTLPTTGSTYSDALDVRLQLVTTGGYLGKYTQEEFEPWVRNLTALVLQVPQIFTLWEDQRGVVHGRVYPGALADELVNVFRSLSHEAPTSATDLDAAAIYLNEAACVALAADVAADLLEAMTPEDAARRRLNPAIVGSWRREAAKVWYQESARRSDLEGAGRTMRWVP